MIDWAAIRQEGFEDFTMSVMPPTLQLPVLPHAVSAFLQRSADETADLKALADILETDAGLTVDLLKRVNSASTAVKCKVITVMQALSLLGRGPSRMFVVAAGAEGSIRARKSKLINQNAFWNSSLQKALFAREVALLLNTDAEIAFAGGLLQDFLLPVLTNDLCDVYLEFVEVRDRCPDTLSEYEQIRFGWDHGLASACLAHQWHLPDELVCCILHHHGGLKLLSHPQLGRTPVAAVALSAMLPDQVRQHHHGLARLKQLEQVWPDFRLAELAESIDRQHDAMCFGVRNDFPLERILKSVKDDHPQAVEAAGQTVAVG